MSQNPDQLSQLLLEADGLLLLLHKHRDETPIDAIKLLRRKLEIILTLTEGLDEEIDEEAPPAANANAPQHVDAQAETVVSDDEDINEAEQRAGIDTDENSIDDTSEERVAEYIEDTIESEPEVEQPSKKATENQPNEGTTPQEVSFADDVIYTAPQAEPVFIDDKDTKPVFFENDTENAIFFDDEPTEPQKEEPAYRYTYTIKDSKPEGEPARRPVSSIFNLNDKFRFRRELFGNSDAQYVECLDLLSAMSTIDEAKEYLYDDLKWDSENEDVKAFVELLSNYYKQ